MPLTFPTSPTNGQTTTLSGTTYTYNATKGVWEATASGGGFVAGAFSEHILPSANETYDIGSADKKIRHLFLSDNSLYIGGHIMSADSEAIVMPAVTIGTGTNKVVLSATPEGGLKQAGTNSAGVAAPVSTAGGVGGTVAGDATTIADMDGLIALTGMTTGQTALVTSLNRIFMYTGTGWFKIADMSNESPSAITGVDGSYTLATDGTATTITAISTDPEGFPLTWSYAVTTGSLGSTATVSQSDNVFTITPSTTEADAGSFSITFSVTDGATGAVNAVSAFTLAFSHEFLVSEIQNSSNANYDISGMFPGNTVCTLSSAYTTSGADTLVTDTSGTQWKLFASFTNNATSTRWGGNKEVQGQLSTYNFSDLTTPRLPPYTGILSYGDIKIYWANNNLGGGAGGYGYYSDSSVALFNSVKLAAVAWAPLTAAQGASSGYAYNQSTPSAGDQNGGPNVAGGWAEQNGAFMVIKPPQGTSEMWITGFNSWNGGGTSYIIFNESDGAITSQAGHGSGSASGLGGANFTDAGMLNDAETFTTILPIADGQLFMQHEMGPQACGIAYVLTR